jgi:hypothetical protein
LEVNGGAREDVEVQGVGAKPVAVKPRAHSGWRWQPVRRWFPDVEGDSGLTDECSQTSSWWPSGAGSRNEGSGIEGVLEWWQWCRHGGGDSGQKQNL